MSDAGKRQAWRDFRKPIERVVRAVDQSARLEEHTYESGTRMLATAAAAPVPFGPLVLSFKFNLKHGKKDTQDRMTTLSYDLTITDPAASPEERIYAWHWHPDSNRSNVDYPHVHVPKDAPFSTKHVPTGRVSLEDVLLFGIEELGVTPDLPNAREIIEEARATHKRHRAWS